MYTGVSSYHSRFVDRLHQAAGSKAVIDLHGRLDLVRCMNCLAIVHRADFQNELALLNTEWVNLDAVALPDSDADLDDFDFSSFAMPSCRSCGGILKPDVVFFGENDPRHNVTAAQEAVEQADTMLVVGSSLTTFGSIAASDGPKRTRPSADAQRPR